MPAGFALVFVSFLINGIPIHAFYFVKVHAFANEGITGILLFNPGYYRSRLILVRLRRLPNQMRLGNYISFLKGNTKILCYIDQYGIFVGFGLLYTKYSDTIPPRIYLDIVSFMMLFDVFITGSSTRTVAETCFLASGQSSPRTNYRLALFSQFIFHQISWFWYTYFWHQQMGWCKSELTCRYLIFAHVPHKPITYHT